MAEKFNLSVILSFITKGEKNFQGFRKNLKELGTNMKGVGQSMTTSLTLPIIGFGANAVRMGADFQSTMNMVGAVTNSTGETFDKLKSQAMLLGRTTQFSARQSAEAMKFMGMAGMDANKIIAASPKVLQLAASAQLDMASAADIVTNIMAGFGFQAKELTGVNDILVDTFTNANVSLPQMGEALKKVGPLAKALKVPFQDVAGALGILGNAGIQGEEAGTGLKTVLARLINPSKQASKAMEFFELNFKDAEGRVKSFPGIIGEFEKALAKGADETQLMAAATEIFGMRGIQIISALVSQGSSELDKLVAKLGVKDKDGLGSATRIAKRQMEGLPGAIKLVTSAWEGLNVALTEGKLGEVVNNLGRELAKVIQDTTKWAEENPKLVESLLKMAGILAIGGPLLLGLGTAVTLFTALTGPIGLIVAGVAGIAAAIELIQATQTPIEGPVTPENIDKFGGMGAAAKGFIQQGMQNEITVKVQAADGTAATVEGVKGDGKVKVESETSVGPTLSGMAFAAGGFR